MRLPDEVLGKTIVALGLALVLTGCDNTAQEKVVADLQAQRQENSRLRAENSALLKEVVALKQKLDAARPKPKPFVRVTVVSAGGGYQIKGTTNLPNGSTLRLLQDDMLQPGAVFDEVTVAEGAFLGPSYTLEGKFKASASAPQKGLESNKQTFEFYNASLRLK